MTVSIRDCAKNRAHRAWAKRHGLPMPAAITQVTDKADLRYIRENPQSSAEWEEQLAYEYLDAIEAYGVERVL